MRGGKSDHYTDGSVDAGHGSAISKRIKRIATIFSKNKKKSMSNVENEIPVDDKAGSQRSSKKKIEMNREPLDLPPRPIKPTEVKHIEESAADKSQKQSNPVVLESHYYEAEGDDETGTDEYTEDCNYSAPAALGSMNHSQIEESAPQTGQPQMKSPKSASSPTASPRKEASRIQADAPKVSPRMASPRMVSPKKSSDEDNESCNRNVINAPMGTATQVEIKGKTLFASRKARKQRKNTYFDILDFLPGCADFDDKNGSICQEFADEDCSNVTDELGKAVAPIVSAVKQKNFFGACLLIPEALTGSCLAFADKVAPSDSSNVGLANFNDAASVLADDLDKLDRSSRDQVDGSLDLDKLSIASRDEAPAAIDKLDLDKLSIASKDEAPAAIDKGAAEARASLDADANAEGTRTIKADEEAVHCTGGIKRGPEESRAEASVAPDDKEAVAGTGSLKHEPEEIRAEASTAPVVDEEAAIAISNIKEGPEESRAEASAAPDAEDAAVDMQEDVAATGDDIEGMFVLSKQRTPSGITNDDNSAASTEVTKEKIAPKVKDVLKVGIAVIELANDAVTSRLTGLEPRDLPPPAEPWKKVTSWAGRHKEKKMSRGEAQQREMERMKIKRRHHKNVQQKRGNDEIEQARLREENASLAGASQQSSYDIMAKSFDSVKTEKSTLDVGILLAFDCVYSLESLHCRSEVAHPLFLHRL
jgi:hypothetical protein